MNDIFFSSHIIIIIIYPRLLLTILGYLLQLLTIPPYNILGYSIVGHCWLFYIILP
jgi:hypothetical protein